MSRQFIPGSSKSIVILENHKVFIYFEYFPSKNDYATIKIFDCKSKKLVLYSKIKLSGANILTLNVERFTYDSEYWLIAIKVVNSFFHTISNIECIYFENSIIVSNVTDAKRLESDILLPVFNLKLDANGKIILPYNFPLSQSNLYLPWMIFRKKD